jgi:hypothetical protein
MQNAKKHKKVTRLVNKATNEVVAVKPENQTEREWLLDIFQNGKNSPDAYLSHILCFGDFESAAECFAGHSSKDISVLLMEIYYDFARAKKVGHGKKRIYIVNTFGWEWDRFLIGRGYFTTIHNRQLPGGEADYVIECD